MGCLPPWPSSIKCKGDPCSVPFWHQLTVSVTQRGAQKRGHNQIRANANKRRQTLTNASKRRGENASKREQTWTNANKRLHPPLLCFFFTPPVAIPLYRRAYRARINGHESLVTPLNDNSCVAAAAALARLQVSLAISAPIFISTEIPRSDSPGDYCNF